ncbi:TOM1-like protein 1 [Apodemus speciosus]|uniref:TOM1-like protein 1 n=1 Tax=Apodemus speciosus TaxID=105296 RepID=A0ABQ0FBQ5_APOSI
MAFGKSHRDPYATSVGHLVEKATFAGLQTEDWGQFMHICDIINTTQDGPKDAVKALKKRISKNYNHKEIQLSLSGLLGNECLDSIRFPESLDIARVDFIYRTLPLFSNCLHPDATTRQSRLIDMCVQNCGPSFQSLIVKKEFVKDTLVKLLNPRYTLPLETQNRILNFIKTWSQGFAGGVDVSEVKEVYLDLLKKGVQFPPSHEEPDTRQEAGQISPSRPTSVPTAPALSSIIAPKSPTISLVPEQIGKLHSELDMVKMNVKVMTAILMENTPGSENHDDIELLRLNHRKLYKTGREMQERIMDLLVVVENEDVTVELIQVNEDLNNAILGYERSRTCIVCSDWTLNNMDHRFTRNQQRLLEQKRNPMEATNTSSEPSAPSCDLLNLSPTLPVPTSNEGTLNSMNAQLSSLTLIGVSSPSPVITNNLYPSLQPQIDLLASEDIEIPTFGFPRGPDKTSPQVTHMMIFWNTPVQYYYSQFPYTLPQQRHRTRGCHPCQATIQMIKNSDLQPPNYYEVMEFDPLAPTTDLFMKKLMLTTRKELQVIVTAEYITKGQLSKVVPDQLRPERQDLPTRKASVDHFFAGSFNTSWPTLLFLTMA